MHNVTPTSYEQPDIDREWMDTDYVPLALGELKRAADEAELEAQEAVWAQKVATARAAAASSAAARVRERFVWALRKHQVNAHHED